MSHLVALVAGWSAAFVLSEAALAKSLAGVGLADRFAAEFGVHVRTTRLLLWSLVGIEVLVVVAIVLRPVAGMISGAVLFLSFAVFGLSVGKSDRSGLHCGCLGNVVELRLGTSTAAPNLALGMCVAIAAFAVDPHIRLEVLEIMILVALAAAVSIVFWISYYGLGVTHYAMPDSLD